MTNFPGDNQPLICPKCGSDDWRCYNESYLDWWYPDGNHAGTQVVGGLKCNACNFDWLDYWPPDEIMSVEGAYSNGN